MSVVESKRPIALTDAQLECVKACAQQLHPADRSAYLQAVCEQLQGLVVDDGAVFRAARSVLHKMRWENRNDVW